MSITLHQDPQCPVSLLCPPVSLPAPLSLRFCLSLSPFQNTHSLFMNQYKDIFYMLFFDSRSLILAEHGLQIEHLPLLLPALSEHPLSQGFLVSGLLKSGRIFVFGGVSLGTLKASGLLQTVFWTVLAFLRDSLGKHFWCRCPMGGAGVNHGCRLGYRPAGMRSGPSWLR